MPGECNKQDARQTNTERILQDFSRPTPENPIRTIKNGRLDGMPILYNPNGFGTFAVFHHRKIFIISTGCNEISTVGEIDEIVNFLMDCKNQMRGEQETLKE